MSDFDVLVRSEGQDIGISEGKIAAIRSNLSGSAAEEIDAISLVILPGVIDAHVHFIGERPPTQTPAYLRHCDVGIVPHTDESFTRSMEPHKAYNYAAAGLPTVTLHTGHPPSLDGLVAATHSQEEFVAAVSAALARGRLSPTQVTNARSLTWSRVADHILRAAAS